jgi:hypothetical protein
VANVSDLIDTGKGFIPVIQHIFKIWTSNGDTGNVTTVPFDKLSQLINQANQQTNDLDGTERVKAIMAMSDALTEVITQAAQSSVALDPATVREINNECDALQTALGLLSEREAFAPIAQLLPSATIAHIKREIDDAKKAIQGRQTAQKVLETTVDVLILAAEIAIKVAAL